MMTTTPNPSEEQIEKAARAFFREYHGEDIWPELRDDGELDTRSRALAATRAALVAAGVAPQAESADHEKLIARLTGSVNALSVTCGECGSKPGNRCYGGGEMRRCHASREAKAERALRIEAADALAAPVLPSSGVDEVRAEAVREVARYINRIAPNGLVPKKMILADMEFAADRLGRGIHANGNDRAVQGGESRGE